MIFGYRDAKYRTNCWEYAVGITSEDKSNWCSTSTSSSRNKYTSSFLQLSFSNAAKALQYAIMNNVTPLPGILHSWVINFKQGLVKPPISSEGNCCAQKLDLCHSDMPNIDCDTETPQKPSSKTDRFACTPENRHIWDKENYDPKKKEFSPTFEQEAIKKQQKEVKRIALTTVEKNLETSPVPLADITKAYRLREPRKLKARRKVSFN